MFFFFSFVRNWKYHVSVDSWWKGKLHIQTNIHTRQLVPIQSQAFLPLQKVKNRLIAFNYVERCAFYELRCLLIFSVSSENTNFWHNIITARFLFTFFASVLWVKHSSWRQKRWMQQRRKQLRLFVFQITFALKWKVFVLFGCFIVDPQKPKPTLFFRFVCALVYHQRRCRYKADSWNVVIKTGNALNPPRLLLQQLNLFRGSINYYTCCISKTLNLILKLLL